MEQAEQVEEAHMTTEEQSMIEQWNDAMFITSDNTDQYWYAQQEQHAMEEQVEQEVYYGEEEAGPYQDVLYETYEEGPRYL